MIRTKSIPESPASPGAQRPILAPDASRSNLRVDELDAQRAWRHHIDTGRIVVRRG